jgi:hypothetical protein
MGLSAYLLVEPRNGLEITVTRIYDSAALSLAGAAIGLFGLVGFRLVGVILRKDDAERPV